MVCKQNPGQASCDARGLLQSLAWLRLKNSLKVTAPFFPPSSILPLILTFLNFSCSEGCYACNSCQNMVMLGSRRKERCRSFFTEAYAILQLRHTKDQEEKRSKNVFCLCATENGNCLYYSQSIEKQMLLRGNKCGTFHTRICRQCTC